MVAQRSTPAKEDLDQRVVMTGMSWHDYEAFVAIRGERSGVRM
jgi:Uma2 family endonuclease